MKKYDFKKCMLSEVLRDKANTVGDRTYLEFQGRKVTFREADDISNRVANGLAELGIEKGSKVAILLPNCLEMLYLWFACAKLGAIDVPINLGNRGVFLSHVINDSNAKLIVLDSKLADRLALVQDDLVSLESVVFWENGSHECSDSALKFKKVRYQDLQKAHSNRPEVQLKPGEAQSIIYTSGTTGPSKGVVVPHTQVYLSAHEYCKAVRAESDDIFFTCLPLFHANARWLCVLPAMLCETKVIIHERLSATRFWDQIRASKATIFNSLGAMATFLYKQPEKENDGDNPARTCMAAPMPKDICEDFQSRYNVKVIEGYGLTETGMITYNPYDKPKVGSCGKELGCFKVRIVDEDDVILPPNVVGEIVVQGQQPGSVCLAYYNLPEKTLESFRNFYFHTGDGGYIDGDGYLYFQDRMKDYIRRRGENISSFEVERVLDSHDKVLETAAVEVKSEDGANEVKAVVVIKTGMALEPEELLAYCEPMMPYFAVPRYIEFVEAIPKTQNEKIRKDLLRDAGVNENTWDREKAGYRVSR